MTDKRPESIMLPPPTGWRGDIQKERCRWMLLNVYRPTHINAFSLVC